MESTDHIKTLTVLGKCPFTPICASCICGGNMVPVFSKQSDQSRAPGILNPLMILLIVNLISFIFLLGVLFHTFRKHWKYLISKAIYILLIITTGALFSGLITLQSFIDWLDTPLVEFMASVKYKKFMCFYIISTFLILNSLGVMMGMLLATIRLKLLDLSSLLTILVITGFKMSLSLFLYALHRNITLSKVVSHLTGQSATIQIYFNILMKLLVPCVLVASTLFISTYRGIMAYKSRFKSRNKSKYDFQALFLSPNSKLTRSTSENSSIEYLNRENIKEIRSPRRKSTANFQFSRFMVFLLIPVYLFSLWISASWLILETNTMMSLDPSFSSVYCKLSNSSEPLKLRELFLIVSQMLMFMINFISLLLCFNFIIYNNTAKRLR